MRLLAAFFAAVFAYLAVGFLIGYSPTKLSFRGAPRRRRNKVSRQQWLLQAGARVSVRQFWATSGVVGALTFVILFALTGAVPVALFPAVAVGALPRAYYGRERAKRGRSQMEAWPDALRNLVASLNATLSLHQALVALGHSGPTALRPVFIRYAQLSRTLDARAALEAIRDELADPVSDRVIEVLLLATEQGPTIVLDVLADLARSTTADLALAERIETAQMEQKLNAKAVFVLPYFILIVMCVSAAEFRGFYQTGGGLLVVAIGGAMSTAGMAMINRLGRQPAEDRLFLPAGERR